MTTVRLLVGLVILILLPGLALAGETPPSPKSFAEVLAEARDRTSKGNWAEATPLWQQVVSQNPTHSMYWLQLATSLYRQKEYRQAIPACTKAFELRAGYPANSAYNIV